MDEGQTEDEDGMKFIKKLNFSFFKQEMALL